MKKKVGRPQKEIKTKRVQCIIPETVLQELDDKVKLLPKNERDRSKVITSAINEWLKPNKKKRLKNLYLKFFGFIDYSLDKGLWGKLNTVLENDEELAILETIEKKLVLGETIKDSEIEAFNKILAKQKFYIDKSFRLNCVSTQVRILAEMLFLNRCYPIKEYAGYCKECGVFFYKEKAKQLFHSPVCKMKYYEKIKKNNRDPFKESKILANEKDVRDKVLKEKLNLSEILRSIDPDKNIIDTVKELIKNICILSGNKFSIFKKLWENGIAKRDERTRLEIAFFTEYYEELIKRYKVKYNINVLKNYTVENFADDIVNDFFSETGNMKIQLKKWLLKSITSNRFNVEKNLIAYRYLQNTLDNKQDYINVLNNTIEYFENTFEKEYGLNIVNDNLKRECIISAKTELFQFEEDLDKLINLYTELLKENRLNLGAYFYLIEACFSKISEEKYRLKIIYYYKCVRRIKNALGLFGVNKIKSEKRQLKEIFTFPNFLKHYGRLTAITATALAINKKAEEALEIMNQPDVKYISDDDKEYAALAYSMIFSVLKNVDKGIEYLEKLNLQPDLFEKSKAFLLKNS